MASFSILWSLRSSLRAFNGVLLLLNYAFYAFWDYRFLVLIAISSLVDYTVGYWIPKSKYKTFLISFSLMTNLGLLAYFKYYGFFISSAQDFLAQIGVEIGSTQLSIVLPVGISFYTFQTLSYSIDVYRGRIKSERDLLVFLNYVSFFPQLVAGPIERANRFLPQFKKPKVFDYQQAADGMRLLLYGFFKKMVIADNIGIQVDAVYGNHADHNGLSLLLASFLFFVQLYADFSAYTDIARGTAKLLGFELMQNFKTPLYATNIPEFWSRWHISLTTWFRDYVFIPLAKRNTQSSLWRFGATLILFALIGLWHGANYTFLLFGLFHGLCFLPRIVASKYKAFRRALTFLNNDPYASKVAMLVNSFLVSFSVIFFRSESLQQAKEIYALVFYQLHGALDPGLLAALPVSCSLLLYEWFFKESQHPFQVSFLPKIARNVLYLFMITLILLFGYFGKEPFYYFQF